MDSGQETRSIMNEEKDDEFKLSELNTQILRQMLDNDESEKITQKVNETHRSTLNQVEMKEVENLYEEQTKMINDLNIKNEELRQITEHEENMRVSLYLSIEHIKKKINNFKTFYNIIKQTVERTSDTKTNIDMSYQDLNQKLMSHINENNMKIKDIQIKNDKINQKLINEKTKLVEFEKQVSLLKITKDEEINKLQCEIYDLKNNLINQDSKYSKELHELNLLIKQKEKYLEEVNAIKEKNDLCIFELKKEIDKLNKQIIDLEQIQTEDKISIEELKKNCKCAEELLETEKKTSENFAGSNNKLERLIENLYDEKDQLLSQINGLESRLNSEKQARNDEQNNYQNDLSETQNTVTQLTEDFNKLINKLDKSEQEVEYLKNEVKTMMDKNENLFDTMNQVTNNYETKILEFQQEIETLNNEVDLKNQELDLLSTKYKKLEEKSSTVQEKLQERYDNVFIENENIKNDMERLKENREEMRKDYGIKLQEIKEECDKKIQSNIYENEKHISQLKQQSYKFSEENSTLKDTIKKLELKMSEINAAKKSLENELEQKIKETEKLVSVQESNKVDKEKAKIFDPLDSSEDNLDKDPNFNIKPSSQMKKPVRDYSWFDDSSDSSFDADYPLKKPKLITKRKASGRTKTDGNDLFELVRDGSSMFKHPKPPAKSGRSSKKTVF